MVSSSSKMGELGLRAPRTRSQTLVDDVDSKEADGGYECVALIGHSLGCIGMTSGEIARFTKR